MKLNTANTGFAKTFEKRMIASLNAECHPAG